MDDVLEGVVKISDGIIVFGRSEEEHGQNLANFINWSAQWKVLFNYDKWEIKKPAITFFGNCYSAAGIQPHRQKIKGIQNMLNPRN